ncbi:MAG: hypothetical protein RJA36_1445 [Pseudomonadota bacterium]
MTANLTRNPISHDEVERLIAGMGGTAAMEEQNRLNRNGFILAEFDDAYRADKAAELAAAATAKEPADGG